jgi:hypothetical protein
MKIEFLPSGSPDCPLIRLYGFDRTEATRLREIVNRLASGSQEAISLHEEIGVEPLGGCKLDLRLGGQDLGIVQNAPLSFQCILTADRWSDMACLLQPFCETEGSIFQWLNEDGKISLLLSRDGKW